MNKIDHKVDMIIKCRVIFLQSIAVLFGENILFDDSFRMVLKNFVGSYLLDNFDKFSLIYYFKTDENGKLSIYEEEWKELLDKYLNCFRFEDDKNIIKLYDDVGQRNVDKISELAEMFYDYIKFINDDTYSLIKS